MEREREGGKVGPDIIRLEDQELAGYLPPPPPPPLMVGF
jgi:hypothetical protein